MAQATACKAVYSGSIPDVASTKDLVTGLETALWSRNDHENLLQLERSRLLGVAIEAAGPR